MRNQFLAIVLAANLPACCGPLCQMEKQNAQFSGGGEDAIVADLPFDFGYATLCTQGAYGSTSHNATSTMFDIDLDTPNYEDVPVFAPLAGTAYVHDGDPDDGFGIHINIDLGDETYLILGHLETVFVDNASEIAAGQLLGFEGTTGYSFGDHVHYGRHAGDASLDGIYGESFDGLILNMSEDGDHVQLMTSDMWCGLPNGDTYNSLLLTSLWHPNGSLVKTPTDPTVYLIEDGSLTPFLTESSFLSRNYDWSDVALITDNELSCYGLNDTLTDTTEVSAVLGSTNDPGVWLMIGLDSDPDRYRLLVPSVGWQAVLKSWGVIASTYDDLYHDAVTGGRVPIYPYSGTASFRDGSLVSPLEDSAVYIMSDGIAMPIKTWDALLFSGWEDRNIIEMSAAEFEAAVAVEGDCGTNTYCYELEDARSCGGPTSGEGVLPSSEPDIHTLEDLILTWYAPDDLAMDIVMLAGAVTYAGLPESGWDSIFNEVQNTSSITVTVPELASGDLVRFSVDYFNDGQLSWSCLGPFPPGVVQGSVTAKYGDTYLGYVTADDPESEGCGLLVAIP
jgi:hypothetical protein